jgi:FMN-dependent NADH-azoreductase
MTIVLDVYALPRRERSRTRKLRDAFFRAYLAKYPDAQRIEIDLANDFDKLPAFDEWDVQTKFEMMYGEGNLDGEMASRWEALARRTDQLHAADLVVVSAPMWNFSIPWTLKRWIDCIVQARLTFEWVGGTYKGLLAGRQAVILATRDGAYPKDSPYAAMDFQVPYLRQILSFIGFDPVHEVVAEPMMAAGVEAGEAALADAMHTAGKLAATL